MIIIFGLFSRGAGGQNAEVPVINFKVRKEDGSERNIRMKGFLLEIRSIKVIWSALIERGFNGLSVHITKSELKDYEMNCSINYPRNIYNN